MYILLVERNDEVRCLLAEILRTQGFAVGTACGPTEAIAMAKSKVPDVIFTSLVFDDMSGFELCRRFRAMPETAAKLIVALTGYLGVGTDKQVMEAGFDEYLLKPVSIENLSALVGAFKK